MTEAGAPQELNADEKAAIRAFVQRSEVRLSTVHRVGSALLSGAGVMVLLPPVAKDSIVTVITRLTQGSVDLARLLLIVATFLTLALPLVAFWLMLRDLVRFYFHAQHLRSGTDRLFLPRFTLTGLRLPLDELDAGSATALDGARREPGTVELLVPVSEASQERLDRQLGGYGIHTARSNIARAEGLFTLAASQSRTLLEEVAKIEHGMTRHILRMQTVVLRYVKALLAFMTTALAVFTMAAIESRHAVTGPLDEAWLAVVLAAWASGTALVTAAPVRWVEQIVRSEGATRTGVANDSELTLVESVSTVIGVVVWLLSVVALYFVIGQGDVGTAHVLGTSAVAAASGAILGWHLWRLRADRRPPDATA